MAGAADVDFGARSHFETLRSCAGGLTLLALAQVTSTGPWVRRRCVPAARLSPAPALTTEAEI